MVSVCIIIHFIEDKTTVDQSFLLLSNGYEFDPSNHRRHKYTEDDPSDLNRFPLKRDYKL